MGTGNGGFAEDGRQRRRIVAGCQNFASCEIPLIRATVGVMNKQKF